ncbi:hypothetical protein RMSM_06721 [Rhodopirellula maiorica SM1]|uniref:Uncharacterized protein n=1 Tax=Rhodopirellula maiorica SM1 TaxID=1265738 RepID=M5RA63_9BACT|nr:hypothetical protein RMSM_06721 [Rhodopirellula maiorica SM1]
MDDFGITRRRFDVEFALTLMSLSISIMSANANCVRVTKTNAKITTQT